MSQLASGERPVAASTVRSYQVTLRLYCEFVTDARYGWAAGCDRRFGLTPVQICHEWNTASRCSNRRRRSTPLLAAPAVTWKSTISSASGSSFAKVATTASRAACAPQRPQGDREGNGGSARG